MKRRAAAMILLCALGCGFISQVSGQELSGYVAPEVMAFSSKALYPGQERINAALAIQPEFYYEWENGSSFTCVPFVRFDSGDSRRSHFDLRELNYLWLHDIWELRFGVGKVFWGTTEFVHLVDIINQTDLVENIDGEDKLGQPMVHLSVPRNWGVIDLFLLPYFRERTFPGRGGRLRFPLLIDTDRARYESSADKHHVDFAVRYSQTIGAWDFGLYYFKGTGREPRFILDFDKNGEPVLVPFYDQINQTGLDLQRVAGQWLLKLEALYRTGQTNSFVAAVGGFEYSLVGIAGTGMDLGLIGEYAYDARSQDAPPTFFQNDVMFGLRLTLNDPASSEILAGFIQDLESPARALSIEASHRLGSNWKASLEGWAFLSFPEEDLFYGLRDDDFLRLELAYYF